MLKRQLAYWKNQLADIPVTLDLPTDYSPPSDLNFQGGVQELALSGELTEGVRQLSRREGVTMFMTLLAAFQVLLARLSGQEDIVVGAPIAGRNRTEVEGRLLTVAEARDGNLRFTAFLEGRARQGALRTVTVRLQNWEGDEVRLEAPRVARRLETRRSGSDRSL